MAAKKRAARTRKAARTKPVSLGTLDKRLARIEVLLQQSIREEKAIERDEAHEEDELEKLEALEKEIRKDVSPHPLTKITYHDLTKGFVGAFFGVVGHFAFFYGHKIAESLSMLRATTILISSMLLLILFLYFTGFRRVKEYHAYLPTRFFVIYVTAISVATLVLFLFGIVHYPIEPMLLFKEVSSVSLLAVMGAATADLVGGEA
jgi:uncharacterized membrane protein